MARVYPSLLILSVGVVGGVVFKDVADDYSDYYVAGSSASQAMIEATSADFRAMIEAMALPPDFKPEPSCKKGAIVPRFVDARQKKAAAEDDLDNPQGDRHKLMCDKVINDVLPLFTSEMEVIPSKWDAEVLKLQQAITPANDATAAHTAAADFWKSHSTLIKINNESLAIFDKAVAGVGQALNKPPSSVTRRDMANLVMPFAFANPGNSFVPTGFGVPLETNWPELFTTHIWDDKEQSFNDGLRHLLKKWNKPELVVYKCIYSNSQFDMSAGARAPAEVNKKLAKLKVFQDASKGWWDNSILGGLFADVAEHADRFSWFVSEATWTEKYKWNFGEMKSWLTKTKKVDNFGFVDQTGVATTGEAAFKKFHQWLTGTTSLADIAKINVDAKEMFKKIQSLGSLPAAVVNLFK